MKKKKIAVIGLKGLPAFGGAARAGESIIDELKHKYDFTVYSVASHTNNRGLYNGYRQIVFDQLPFKKLNVIFYYITSALHCLFKGDYDVINVHHFSCAFIIPLLKLKYKVIATTQGKVITENDKWNRFEISLLRLMQLIWLKFPANILVSVSKPLANSLKGKTPKEILYIPNAVHLNNIKPQKSIKYKDYLLFAAGRIVPWKGCHTFIQALNKLNYQKEVFVVGDLDQKPDYGKEIKYLARSLNIHFTGLIKEKDLLLTYVTLAKLFIFPSYHEGLSLMLLEAASMKTPLICSDIPENTAVFSNQHVLFFKMGDSRDLAEKITWALANENIMKEKAIHAFNHLKVNYNSKKIANEYSNLFCKLIINNKHFK